MCSPALSLQHPASLHCAPLRLPWKRLFCSGEVLVGVFHIILGKKSEAAFAFPMNFRFAWTLFR